MSNVLLLDTNIVIEHLRSGILRLPVTEVSYAVSVITEAELFQYAGMSHEEEDDVSRFLQITKIFSVDSCIARTAASLGKTRKIQLLDLLIAATALEYGVPLITHNLRDFKNIPDLIVRSTAYFF